MTLTSKTSVAAAAVEGAAVERHVTGEGDVDHRGPQEVTGLAVREVLGRPRRCKWVRAFLSEYSDKRLKLAQL